MKILWNTNDYIIVLGIDNEEEMLEVIYSDEVDYDLNDIKYLRKGSLVLWEDNPPTCSKCIKNNKTSCSKKCYDFKAIHPSKMEAIKKSNESKRAIFKAEKEKIEEMKRLGIKYKSLLFTSLFESADNTERMIFV